MEGVHPHHRVGQDLPQPTHPGFVRGFGAHSFLSLNNRLSAAFALVLAVCGHAVGWPIPRGGAQSIPDALCRYLSKFEVLIFTSHRVEDLASLDAYEVTLCDVTPRQLLALAPHRLSSRYKQALREFQYGPGVFKVDYGLCAPIPWKARECLRAATVHLGGRLSEIAAAEEAVQNHQHPIGLSSCFRSLHCSTPLALPPCSEWLDI